VTASDAAVVIPRSRAWQEGTLSVMLAWPEQPPPPSGYPVLCLLDGHALFGTATEAARLQAGRPGATGVQPGVILALGHRGDRATQIAGRRRDYTPPLRDPVADTGGADAFLHLVGTAILPRLARCLPIDPARVTLFGHSLGGLLPLHALFSGSLLFRAYVAASPSLWWGDRVLLHRAQRFAAAPRPLLLTVGGNERPDPASTEPVRLARQREARMVEGVHELAACLSRSLPVACVEFPGENHGSVLPAAISRAVPFALGAGP